VPIKIIADAVLQAVIKYDSQETDTEVRKEYAE
jgi:hypothetical protein